MKITQIKCNGVREPMGFALSPLTVSFKVTETESKKPRAIRIELSEADAPEAVLAACEGAELDMTGTVLDAALQPRTAYVVRVHVEGDTGDTADSDRQATCVFHLKPVKYPLLYVTEPASGGWDSLMA